MIQRHAKSAAVAWLAVLLMASHTGLASGPGQQQSGGDDGVIRVQIPLTDGRLEVGDLVAGVCEAAGIPVPPGVDELDWAFDVGSTAGWLQLEAIRRGTGGVLSFDARPERLVVRVDPKRLEGLAVRLEHLVGKRIEGARSEAARRDYGITFVTDAGTHTPIAGLEAVPARAVILVHGLDEPGWRWRDLIPALRGAGHAVAQFEYPNDGPVADSADLLARELASLRMAGVDGVDLVAHSMGGLVARDVLTRRAYYAGDGIGGGVYPRIDRLIMLGTPNAGTNAAVLHGFGEVVEHAFRAWQGLPGWGGVAMDGRGEAAVDLLPGSVYLRRLNARPLPAHTRITIIAGRASPLSEQELTTLAEQLRALAGGENAPEWLKRLAADDEAGGAASSLLRAAVRGVGDGLVTLDSARLEGVDDVVILEANHQSMLVNTFSTTRTPPAIPIILDRLGELDR